MKGFRLGLLALTGIISTSLAWSGVANAASSYRSGEIIVKYKSGTIRTRSAMESIYRSINTTHVKRYRGILSGFEHLTLQPDSNVEQAVATLSANPAVEYAQPNYILKALPVAEDSDDSEQAAGPRGYPCLIPGIPFPPGCQDEPSEPSNPGDNNGNARPAVAARPADVQPPVADPDLASAYGLGKVQADRAWADSKGNSNFIVAVIDTGIDYNHEDLAYNVWRNPAPGAKNDVVGYDFVHDDGLPFDDNKHGTHCAGVIGATGGNGKGISGINQRVSLMALKFLDAEGSGDTAGAIAAVDYAISHGAKVLSNSWGGGDEEENRGLREAILRAEARDVLFVAAAGNDSTDNDHVASLPASYDIPNIIAVASTDNRDRLSRFSNYGAHSVHLAAPGSAVYSTVPGGYARLSGTSMACPHVAGAAALVWANNPGMTYRQVKDRLLSTVDRLSSLASKVSTGGRLNVYNALHGTNGSSM